MIIGLTGGIGSGKTTVANLFKKFNSVAIYVADVEAKKLMHTSTKLKANIIKIFGENAYKNNVLDREFIGSIVFKDKLKLKELNEIVHPEVRSHFKKFVQDNSDKTYVIYESAILFESNSQDTFDFIISVYADLKIRIQRVVARDNVVATDVLLRMNNQWKEDKKTLQSHYIIYNNSQKNIVKQVNNIHKILTEKAL